MSLQRREFFAILSACAINPEELLAQHHNGVEEEASTYSAYRPRVLTQAEYDLVDELAETLLPSDETGPGAHDAHVAYYIDVVLFHGKAGTLQSWKNGLAQVEVLVKEHCQQSFSACSDPQRQELLTALAKNEMAPLTETDLFFVEFKRTAIDGFYASELIQREHLGYKGNTAIPEFAGCTANFGHPNTA